MIFVLNMQMLLKDLGALVVMFFEDNIYIYIYICCLLFWFNTQQG